MDRRDKGKKKDVAQGVATKNVAKKVAQGVATTVVQGSI